MKLLFTTLSLIIFFQVLCAQGPPPGIDPNNEFYKLGYLDVTLYGADPTGNADATDEIKEAIIAARDYSLVCYFPTGTYLVSDTLTAKLPATQVANGRWNVDRRKPCVLVGGYPRPTIKLAPNAPGYGNANNPKPVVWIWAEPRGDGGSIPGDNDPLEEEHGIAFNMVFKGINIDLSNNSGAIGVHFNGAQGSTLEDVTISANGAFSGFRGTHGGAGSGYYNVEVIGGRHGVVITDPHQSLCGTYAGAKFINQTQEVFVLPMYTPLVITGFQIQKNAGPIISSWATRGGISLIDGVIEFTGSNSAPVFNVPAEKNLILNNVFIRGANNLKTNVPLNPSQWNQVNQFAFCGSEGANLIGGNVNQNQISDITLGAPNINALLTKHIWDESSYPKIEDRFDSDFVDVTDPIKMRGNHAIGDGLADDSDALQYAIDSFYTVFLPKGIYKVNKTIRLKYNTKLFGAGKTYSVIRADKNWQPAAGTAIVETIFNANAQTSISWILIESYLKENPMLTSLKWRVGRNTFIRDIMMGYADFASPTDNFMHNHHGFEFSHFGGGKVYALAAEWTKNQPASKGNFYRGLLVNGTTEPLSFYGLNVERIQSPIQTEIRNASNVDIFFYKSEAGSSSGGNDILAKSVPLLINNSTDINVHACTGNIVLENGDGFVTVQNSNNVQVDAVKGYAVGADWNNIKDELGEVNSAIDLALFKTGTPNTCSGQFPASESFETGLGNWTQGTNDDINWTRDANGTPSSGTGPASGSDGQWYMYIEASGANNPNKTASLVSECFNINGTVGSVSFDYHMNGAATGMKLDFQVSTNSGNTWTSLWSNTNSAGDQWNSTVVDISAYTNMDVNFRFFGTTGDSWRGDIAIDNIKMSSSTGVDCPNLGLNIGDPCNDGDPNTINDMVNANCVCIGTPQNSCNGQFPASESFESGLGSWSQGTDDNINWTRDANGTPSGGTGPSSGSAGQWYIYMEASGANHPGKTASLVSDCFNINTSGGAEVRFDYHMNGRAVGMNLQFQASTNDGSSWNSLWSNTNSVGDQWNNVIVDVSVYINTDVIFRFFGTTGSSFQGDIAIDNIQMNTTTGVDCPNLGLNIGDPCNDGDTNTINDMVNANCICIGTPQNSCSGQLPESESFETGIGNWVQGTGDDIDWTRDSNGTPSNGTGPSSGSQGQWYMYIESSGANNPNKRASLISECFDLSAINGGQLSFDYHMNGSSNGMNLQLLVSTDNGGSWTSIWNNLNSAGDQWNNVLVDISNYSSSNVYFRFMGTTGDSWRGDIAIDNIQIDTMINGVDCPTLGLNIGDPCNDGDSNTINDMVNANCNCVGTSSNCVGQFPMSESFETGIGNWVQGLFDDLDWIRDSNGTPSSGTGPSSGSQGQWYMYVESSGSNTPSKRASLNSECINVISSGGAELRFDYHMNGSSNGMDLKLVISTDNGASWSSIWNNTNSVGNQWNTVILDISAYKNREVYFRFVGTTGNFWQGDIALDNIQMYATNDIQTSRNKSASVSNQNTHQFSIYPNPLNQSNELHIEVLKSLEVKAYEVYDLTGKVLMRNDWDSTKMTMTIQVDDLTYGTYLIRLQTKDGPMIKKFVVIE